MHRVLKQQIAQYLAGEIPDHLSPLLDAVNAVYEKADLDSAELKRSLRTTSNELLLQNKKLNLNLEEQKAAQRELSRSFSIINATLDASQEGVLVINHDGIPILFNDRYLQINQLTESRLMSMTHQELLQNSMDRITEPERLKLQMTSLAGESGSDNRGIYQSHDGHWVEAYACNDPVAGFIWMLRDITEVREKEATIAHQAQHDALTELPNRTLLLDRMENAINRAHQNHQRFAVCYLDLDAFKTVNDSLGHDAGDQLLIKVSKRLKTRIREGDTIARIGGDEFVIVLDDISHQEEVLYMAERLLMALNEPIMLAGRKFFVGASMGIAMYPNDGEEPGVLLKNSDIAMYRAKQNGKNRFHFFTPSLERVAQHRLAMETKLRKAMENEELELYYQPKVYLAGDGKQQTGTLHSFEALLRWPQPGGGFISPESFIHIAEDAGMIGHIGNWVLEHAAVQAKAWYQQGLKTNISINISPKQFLIPDFEHDIIDTLKALDTPENLISLEITESLLMQDLESARHVLEFFRENGVKIYLDDFGTGFSSLNYLKNLPVDSIKIDRTFVKDLSNNPADQAIASSIIALGKNLGMSIVAEGVETQAQANILIAHGCDLAQGYYYGRPVSAAEAEQFFPSRL